MRRFGEEICYEEEEILLKNVFLGGSCVKPRKLRQSNKVLPPTPKERCTLKLLYKRYIQIHTRGLPRTTRTPHGEDLYTKLYSNCNM